MSKREPNEKEIKDLIKLCVEDINNVRGKRIAYIKNASIKRFTFPDDEYEVSIKTIEGVYKYGYIWKYKYMNRLEFEFQDCGIFF